MNNESVGVKRMTRIVVVAVIVARGMARRRIEIVDCDGWVFW